VLTLAAHIHRTASANASREELPPPPSLRRFVSADDLLTDTTPAVPAFPWHGVTPEGSPLIAREAGTQEIYTLDVDFA